MKIQDTYQEKISPTHTPKKGHIQNLQRAEELLQLKNKTNGNKMWARFEYTLHTHTHTHTMLLFSHSVVSKSLRAHGLQHTRLPCPSLFSGVCSNSCPLSQ